MKRVNTIKTTLYVDTNEQHKVMINTLINENISFFIYTRKVDKTQSWLLEGISPEYTEEEISEEIRKRLTNAIKVLKVIRFETKRSIANRSLLPMFLVQISADSDPNAFLKINNILHQAISWEKIIKREAAQCRRCQRIGHSASNCNLPYRCVKCKENHGPGECLINH